MDLTRSSSGLLFRDDFNRADGAPGANWEVVAGTWAIVSNRLRSDLSGDDGFLRCAAIPQRGPVCIQAKEYNGSMGVYGELIARAVNGRSNCYSHNIGGTADSGKTFRLHSLLLNGGTQTVLGYKDGITHTTERRHKFHVEDGRQRLYKGTLAVSVLPLDVETLNTVHDGVVGDVALSTNNSAGWTDPVYFNDFIACESNYVTCSNMQTGWKLRVGSLVAVESAGVATLDLQGTVLPAATVEVLDGADVVQATLSPADGVWGGDTYSLSEPNLAPVADFTSVLDGRTASVDGSASSDPDGSIASYSWDWGDGSPAGSGITAEHTYAPGTYTITLTVTDDQGATDTATTSVTVANELPVASFDASATNRTVSVDGSASSDPDGSIASYAWDWGDGSPAGSGVTATHEYAAAGTYTITLTVTDNDGGTDTATTEVTTGGFVSCPAPGESPWATCEDTAPGDVVADDQDIYLYYHLDDEPEAAAIENVGITETDGTPGANLISLREEGRHGYGALVGRVDINAAAIANDSALSIGGGAYPKSAWPGPYTGYTPPDLFGGLGLDSSPRGTSLSAWVRPTSLAALIVSMGSAELSKFTVDSTADGLRVLSYPAHGNRGGALTKNDPHAGVALSVGSNAVAVTEHAHGHLICRLEAQGLSLGDRYHHLVLVVAGTDAHQAGGFKLYVDGVDASSLAGFREQGSTKARPFFHGHLVKGDTGSTVDYFAKPYEGYLDEVRFYNRALTPQEVQEMYESESVGTIVSLWESCPDPATSPWGGCD